MSDMTTQLDPAALSVVSGALAGTAPAPAPEPVKSDVQRGQPEVTEAVKKHVKQLLDDIKKDKAHRHKTFKQMKHDIRFTLGKNQHPNQREDDDRYVVNIVQRHIRQRVAKIYAKNPKATAKRKQRMKYVLWDGKSESLAAAQQTMAQTQAVGQPGAPPIDPTALAAAGAIVEDITNAMMNDEQLDRIGKTGEILFHYFIGEQEPSFKKSMKSVVRRAKTCKVGYVRMGFKRVMGREPKEEQGLIDSQRRIDEIKRIRADLQDEQLNQADAEVARLQAMVDAVLKKDEVVLREGLDFDFPHPTRVIPGKGCTQLDGFVGAPRVTIEIPMTVNRVKAVYKIDLAQTAQPSERADGSNPADPYSHVTVADKDKTGDTEVLVLQTYVRADGLMYTVVDGYEGYLAPPETPVGNLERFYPIYAYVPNELEPDIDADNPYPPSDVELMMHQQKEINRMKEGLKQHRIANRPVYISPHGALQTSGDASTQDDKKSLAEHAAHEIVELNGLAPGQKAEDMLAPLKKAQIEPALYETEGTMLDAQRAVGGDDNEFGTSTGDPTATEASIADNERMTSVSEDIDTLDGMLSDIARDAFKIMASEISEETAKRIAGPGAMWPQLSRQEIAEELYLDIVAGSSGKPNSAQEVAKLKEVIPLAVQIPGMMPKFWAEKLIRAVDPGADLAEAFSEGLQAMVTMNRAAGAAGAMGGSPSSAPEDQGEQGANNAPQVPGQAPAAGQAQFPAGGPALA